MKEVKRKAGGEGQGREHCQCAVKLLQNPFLLHFHLLWSSGQLSWSAHRWNSFVALPAQFAQVVLQYCLGSDECFSCSSHRALNCWHSLFALQESKTRMDPIVTASQCHCCGVHSWDLICETLPGKYSCGGVFGSCGSHRAVHFPRNCALWLAGASTPCQPTLQRGKYHFCAGRGK